MMGALKVIQRNSIDSIARHVRSAPVTMGGGRAQYFGMSGCKVDLAVITVPLQHIFLTGIRVRNVL